MGRRTPWKRWRYVTAGRSLLTFLAGLLGTWGQEPVRALAVGGGLTLASVVLYLVQWWLHGTHLRERGWEWVGPRGARRPHRASGSACGGC